MKIRLHLFFLFFILGFSAGAQTACYSFQAIKMGTEFNIKIYGDDSIKIKRAAEAVWLKIDSLNDIFSDYSHTSELARLHQDTSGGYFKMSPTFAYLLNISLKYSKLSHGAFDISVGTLARLWRRAIKLNDFPDSIKIREALRFVGYKKISIKKNRIRLPPGMRLDFGAIAKGYAADQAYEVLVAYGYPVSLVDAGGDIYVGHAPPDPPAWGINMTLKAPDGGLHDSIVYIHDAAIVTSGDAYKFIEDTHGHRYSHIINPMTGYGIRGPHLITVIAVNGMHADALATTLSVIKDSAIK
ncbi:MAG: FAD:protein FMN transferase, partial [Saprospiraceae bacterium]